jgi:hypothetical protein
MHMHRFQRFCHFLNATWKSCSVRVFSNACLDHLNCVKMAAFQFCLQSGKQRKVGWAVDYSHVVFGQKFRDENGSM